MHTGAVFMHLSLQSYWHFDSKTCQDYTLAVILCTCHVQAIGTSLPKTARITHWLLIHEHVTSKLLTLRFQNCQDCTLAVNSLTCDFKVIDTSEICQDYNLAVYFLTWQLLTIHFQVFDPKSCQDCTLAVYLLTYLFQVIDMSMPGSHTGYVFIDMSPLPCSWHFGSQNCQDYTLAVYLLKFHFQVTDI